MKIEFSNHLKIAVGAKLLLRQSRIAIFEGVCAFSAQTPKRRWLKA
ncbi:hypothetical protein [Acetanaerobacterium elongatum]|nr:hypothetical protein [Acetanaerobacterium elongatum]